ncbi:ABC transporter permease [Pedobacter foliorum]|uniref:ABC transporter permease n=1 Tax=Pedobacter foliorum TaxID=2739058 RepID=UPI0015650A5F|nr:ABC transporter permease [Pedobacter foliorum]NRF40085.1 ABC transporter permease [Pedobacter foliorum]
MFRNYFTVAIRNLHKQLSLSLINILGLSIGLACCLLILLYISDELSFDRFHRQRTQLYQLTCLRTEQDGTSEKFAISALVQGPAFKQRIPEILDFIRVNTRETVLKKGQQVANEQISWVDAHFFQVFTFPLLEGDPRNVLQDPHSMVLTEPYAKKYFGSASAALGQSLGVEVNGKFELFKISGIAMPAPENSSIQFSILLPFSYFQTAYPDNGWMWVSFPTYFLLSAGADIAQVEHKMNQIYAASAKEEIDLNHLAGYGNQFSWGLQPLTSMHLNTDYQGTPMASDPLYAYILAGVALFTLVIACINFINLTIAQSLKRTKEIGMRKVIGGSRRQLLVQFLAEALLICLLAFILGIFLAGSVLPVFNHLCGKNISLIGLWNWQTGLGLLFLLLITGLSAGFYPALVLSALSPINALAGKTGLIGKNYLAKGLVVFQFALATFLIISTLFIYAQFNLLTKTWVGYPDQNLLSLKIPEGIRNRQVMERYRVAFSRISGINGVGYKNIGHFGGKTQAAGKQFTATYEHVNESYLSVLGVQLIQGRNFSTLFASDSLSAVLVNQSLVKKAGWRDPLGQTIDYMNLPGWGSRKLVVVGVVRDYHNESLKERIQPMVFTGEPSLPLGEMIIRIRPENRMQTLAELEKVFHRLSPDHPFEYQFREEYNRNSYRLEAQWKEIISFAACLTIFISCIGLFGLTMLTAKRREKEIGVRKVLGASVSSLAMMLGRDFSGLVLLSFLMAFPLGWLAMQAWLEHFPYRVALSWWRFALAGGGTMLVALLTLSYQAIKAARASPVTSLRKE